MTSFSPLPEPRRPAGGRPAGGSDGGWRTGPDEDWHTAPQPAVPAPRPGVPAPPWVAAPAPEPAVPQWAAVPAPQTPAPQTPAPRPPEEAAQASQPVRDGDEAWAMLSYLGVPFVSILAPLAVFLVRARSSDYVRQHATQALNLSITIALYNICAVIVAAMLSLDAVGVALEVTVPAALALWLVTLAYLLRAAIWASLGEFYQLPRWICATIAR